MEIVRLITGEFQTNTYLIKNNDKCVVIDPSGNGSSIIKEIGDLKLSAILLTHGHFDHIKAVDKLHDLYGAQIFLHKNDEELVRNKSINSLFGHTASIKNPTTPLEEGVLVLDGFEFNIYHTPGHTEGSILIKIENNLFTGDTLFKNSVGRTDLYGGDDRLLKDSLKIFKTFKENLFILPGHDEISSLYDELSSNPYL